MPRAKHEKIKAEQLTGLKYFDKLAPLLGRLHDAGCERDKAGNRQLHFDQFCMLQLLCLFNPIVSSLRALQQASELEKVQKRLGCGRASLEQAIEPDRCYVMDRGYAKFALFNHIHRRGSSYVCRLRDNSRFEVVEDRPLSESARAADVTQDAIVSLGEGSKTAARPDHPIRLVIVKIPPHAPRHRFGGGTGGHGSDGLLRIATNLLDVPAEIIALVYRYRWTIELFFRVLKQGCRVEKRRFEYQDRVTRFLAVALLVAWRTLYVTRLGRDFPDLDCSAVFEASEWKAVYQVTQKQSPPKKPPKLQAMVRMVAQLRGYVNRPRNDEPGPETIWKGLQRMHDMALCWDTFGPGSSG